MAKVSLCPNQYPKLDDVILADREQVCRWYRFLPSPTNALECAVMDKVVDRFRKLGGFTPEISKKLGWEVGR